MTKQPSEERARRESRGQAVVLDKHWHLARDETEVQLTELEFALYRVSAAFERWRSECLAAVTDKPLSSTELTVLHVIKMKDRPKTIAEVGRLLNRDDIANLQYAIRKLLGAGLIEKNRNRRKKGIDYNATKLGEEVAHRYADLRRKQLIPMVQSVHDVDSLIDTSRRMLELITGIYDSAALTVFAHRRPFEEAE